MSDLENLDKSAIWDSFEVFFLASCSCFTTRFPWGYLLLSPGSVVVRLSYRLYQALLIPSSLFIAGVVQSSWMDFVATVSNVQGGLVN